MVNLEFVCAICGDENLLVEGMEADTDNMADMWDAAEKIVVPKGWAVRNDNGRRYAVGPVCARKNAALPELLGYDPRGRCPKCGYGTVSTTYFTGRESSATIRVEHLKRECKRCGYVWQERPKDGTSGKDSQ